MHCLPMPMYPMALQYNKPVILTDKMQHSHFTNQDV
jgi:hypothetical protein